MIAAGAWRLSCSSGTVPPLRSGTAIASGICSTLVCPPAAWNTKACSVWSGPLTMASRSFFPRARSHAGTPTWCTA